MSEISSYHLGTLLVCAVRYAIGRQTYMPSAVQEIVREQWDHLSANDRKTIRHDVAEAITDSARGSRSLGADFDERGWREFLTWIDSKLSETPAETRCRFHDQGTGQCPAVGTLREVAVGTGPGSPAMPTTVPLCDLHFETFVLRGNQARTSMGTGAKP